MFEIKKNFLYNNMHFWINIENNNIAKCGLSDYGQSEYGNIIFIELPEINKKYKIEEKICTIESTKSISDLYAPISGAIVQLNENLNCFPNLINKSSYDKGWMFKINISKKNEINTLLSAEQYNSLVK